MNSENALEEARAKLHGELQEDTARTGGRLFRPLVADGGGHCTFRLPVACEKRCAPCLPPTPKEHAFRKLAICRMSGGGTMSGRVVFIANSLDNAYKFQKVLSEFDVEIAAGSTLQIKRLFQLEDNIDLVIFEARGLAFVHLEEIESLVEGCKCPLLVIIDESGIARLRLPVFVPSDFVMHDAGTEECTARVRKLLDDSESGVCSSVLTIGSMTVNLDTYQVEVGGEPIDFTYLEYALLAFLLQHPNHTFSRDALLQHVWGMDYYGGSRTVDVHVRRIRSKLGPDLACHLETVRGVGYLWNLDER